MDEGCRCLSGILTRVKCVGSDGDKLQGLKWLIPRRDVEAGKVFVFSEADTTIKYLHRELSPNGEDPEIAGLTGNNRHEAENIVKCCSTTKVLCPNNRFRLTGDRNRFPFMHSCCYVLLSASI